MRLKRATLFYLLAIGYYYILNVIGTAFPGIISQAAWLVQTVQLLSVLAGIAAVYFYAVFYLVYPREDQLRLKQASMLAVIGTSASLILYLRGLFMVIGGLRTATYAFSPGLLSSIQSGSFAVIGPVVSWGSSMLILLFFYRFCRCVPSAQRRLKNAVLSGFIGALIVVLGKTSLGLVNVILGDLQWVAELSHPLQLILTQPTTGLAFIAVLYFFLVFYREQVGPDTPPVNE
ncbi:hypothetical protein ACFL5M_00505 [Candidatus Neomarinimicrobiota bacterium]